MASDKSQRMTDPTGLKMGLDRIKSENQPISPQFLRSLVEATGIEVFIETGTFYGDTTAAAAGIFPVVHTIELSAELHALAIRRFTDAVNVQVHHGESAEVLAKILPIVNCPLMFWLDAHYSEANTACGPQNTPILAELSVIKAANVRSAVILIDDIRCFQKASEHTRDSLRGYPTVKQIRESVLDIDPQATFMVLGDVVCAAIGDVRFVPSELIKACTTSRMFESEDDVDLVLKAEQVISACADPEKSALTALADDFEGSGRFGLGAHYRLWRGLVRAHEARFVESSADLRAALQLGCVHWRVRWYLLQSLLAVGEKREAQELLATVRREAPDFAPASILEKTLKESTTQVSATCTDSTGEDLAIRRCIRPGAVVFDVGANIGDWTRAALKHASDIEVHLFEASPSTFECLRESFLPSNRLRLVLNQIALGNQQGTRRFHHYTDAPAWSTFYRRVEAEKICGKQPPAAFDVPMDTLDSYSEAHAIQHIDYLKIDTEGAEYEVLLGASTLLSRGAIDYIQFEYGGTYADAGTSLRLVDALLRRFGYAIFRIDKAGFEPIPAFHDGLEDFEYSNYLAVNERLLTLFLGTKPEMLDLGVLLPKFSVVPRGVIHIGAHEGREAAKYTHMGIKRALFIEANPEVYRRLEGSLSDYPGSTAIHCAVGDTNGTATLHVTSMDQSSSILPLMRHRDIYPDIVESAIVTVPMRTIDSLLVEHKVDDHVFNVMNIDIQGAELLALRGSEQTLRYIDAINTEVNYDELYEGCARIEEIDSFLADRGFTRVATTTPFHPSWGDALYVRKPVITMSTLGSNGRFANQIFQYAFLRIHAQQHGCRVTAPQWIGRDLFGANDPYPDNTPLREVRQMEQELLACDIVNSPEPLRNVDLWGYFQYHTRFYAAHKELFRSLFRPVESLRTELESAVARLRKRGRTVVGLHLRRGDYGYRFFYVTPAEWYKRWLAEIWDQLEEPVLFIASDDPDAVLADFADYNPVTVRDLGIDDMVPAFYQDFYILSQCNRVAISNSSYSFAACMLNEKGDEFMRPDLTAGSLVAFDPWNSEPLLRNALAEDYGPPFLVRENAVADSERRRLETQQMEQVSADRKKGATEPAFGQQDERRAAADGCRVSVYITSFNQKQWLAEAIDSVLAQTFKPHEIIIVDDASTDGSQALIENYRQRFPDLIRPIFHSENRGITRSRIDALSAVTGDYVTYVDGDDRVLPDKLAREVAVLQDNPDAELVYSNFYFMDEKGNRTSLWAEDVDFVHTGWVFPHVFARNFPKRTLFRNELVACSALKRVGFHDSAIDVFEDFELRIRLTLGVQVAYCDYPLAEYRRHDQSLSNARLGHQLQALDYIFTKNRQLLSVLSQEVRDAVITSYQTWIDEVILPAVERQVAEQPVVQRDDAVAGENVILLLDTPWSGAALLRQVFSKHAALRVGHDTGVLSMFFSGLESSCQHGGTDDSGGIGGFLSKFENGKQVFADAAKTMACELYMQATSAASKQLFVDHSADYIERLDKVRYLLPQARFVFLLRHPAAIFDTACLQEAHRSNGQSRSAQDLAADHELQQHIGRLLEGVQMAGAEAVVVHFEDLVRSPESALRRLFARLGLSCDAAVVRHAAQFSMLEGWMRKTPDLQVNQITWHTRILARGDGGAARRFLEALGPDVVEGLDTRCPCPPRRAR